ncbi:MAG: GNAT family N-acetyltransferase, partial [Hyphomicrobiales bacterium]
MGEPKEAQNVVRVEPSIGAIDVAAWDACANPPTRAYNPFVSHAFLEALEDSGSVSADAGWLPQHLVLQSEAGDVLGCLPCYLKNHSQGEYVFDYGWASAFESAGGTYYPKLQCSVPFTPATGRRLLVRDDEDRQQNETLLAYAAVELTKRLDASSLHLTFLTEGEWQHLGDLGLLRRTDQQFHWLNRDYGTFDDYLAALSSRKRKAVRRERRTACSDDVTIEWVTGADIGEEHWDAFFAFYMDTGSRKWGSPYLNRRFFSLVTETMRDRILLIMCRRQGHYIAGALNFIGGETLYGRYW